MASNDIFSAISKKSDEQSTSPEIVSEPEVVNGDRNQSIASGSTQRVVKITSASQDFAKLNKLTTNGFNDMNKTMKDGFSSLKGALLEFGNMFKSVMEEPGEINEEQEEEDVDGERTSDVPGTGEDEDSDVFNRIAGAKDENETGPAVQANLAKMMDKLLTLKMGGKDKEDKEEKYKRPQNIEFARVPKTNSPVFDSLRVPAKKIEKSLQGIQSDVVRSSLPICQVMETLFQNKDTPGEINAVKLIETLSDSLNFIGCANVGLIKMRKENIKKELPQNMQGLCRDPEVFSAKFLFGDELNDKIKEVTELNKVKNKFDKDSYSSRDNYRGAGRGRARAGYSSFRGASRGQWQRRFKPYTYEKPKNFKRGGNQPSAPKKQ